MPHPNQPIWDQGEAIPLPRLTANLTAEACVIGLGGTGLRALRLLADAGVRAVGLDAGEVAAGAAGRNGGFLLAGPAKFYHRARAELGAERARQLYRATLDEIRRMAEETPSAVRLVGSLRIAADAEELRDCRAHLAALGADGFPGEWYQGEEGAGLLLPTDGTFNPLLRCRLLARGLLSDGVALFGHSRVTSVAPGLVTTDGGSVSAPLNVVAVDGGLERLLPELASTLRTGRLQMLATAPTDEVRLARPVYYRGGMEYWQQLADGSLALGGFRDIGGEGEWTTDPRPGGAVQQALERFLRQHLGVQARITHRWAACVGFVSRTLPVCREIRSGVWALGGYSGTGNVIGPLCAQAVVNRALGLPGGAGPVLIG